jgi:hypothetical protein
MTIAACFAVEPNVGATLVVELVIDAGWVNHQPAPFTRRSSCGLALDALLLYAA